MIRVILKPYPSYMPAGSRYTAAGPAFFIFGAGVTLRRIKRGSYKGEKHEAENA